LDAFWQAVPIIRIIRSQESERITRAVESIGKKAKVKKIKKQAFLPAFERLSLIGRVHQTLII
jgi:hypothetical protein